MPGQRVGSDPEVGSGKSPGKRRSEPAVLQLQKSEPPRYTWSQTGVLAEALWAAAVSRLASPWSGPQPLTAERRWVGCRLHAPGADFSTTNSATERPKSQRSPALSRANVHLSPLPGEVRAATSLISSSSSLIWGPRLNRASDCPLARGFGSLCGVGGDKRER